MQCLAMGLWVDNFLKCSKRCGFSVSASLCEIAFMFYGTLKFFSKSYFNYMPQQPVTYDVKFPARICQSNINININIKHKPVMISPPKGAFQCHILKTPSPS